ncbi:MAG: 2-phospho-L-lactate/phosphoenolpyruvate guanylyltransferase [Solirubrobacteraceae bacterium]|jgi:2-phospho-L-lactate guanylyltransferase|nr:2-phospho-L-lactate/phosphoenolpyruvate guanylyltransferase [Solirubrobacteraceae bacterium]
MSTLAILPVKRFGDAKSRLSEALARPERRALAEAMFSDVLTALRRTRGLAGIIVVSGDLTAQRIAGSHGADVVEDRSELGQSAAAALGITRARQRAAARALLVPGDCPALDSAELSSLLTSTRTSAIVADRHGTGTNGLLLSPPDAFEPAFGENSFARHVELASSAEAALERVELPSLGLDVDSADDLAALREHLALHRGGAAHTRGLLIRLERTASVPVP